MLDTLIREISARWGLADQGRSLVQMLVAYISNPATGGLAGFLDKFRKAGWGGMVNTWVDNKALPEIPTTAQVETVMGSSRGLLGQAASLLGLPYDKVSAAVAGILPLLVARMTPDGTIPATLPAEFSPFVQEGKTLLAQGAAATTSGSVSSVSSGSAGVGKWWPWVLGALIVIFGVSYCSKTKDPAPVTPMTETKPMPVEPAPPAVAALPATPAPESGSAPVLSADLAAPDGAGVMDNMHNGMPALHVFFDTGKTDVAPAFADKSKPLVDFLKANADVTAVISGFNDPTGDPARNAQLSKQRAESVKAALEAAGVSADRAVLEKPAETTDAGASNAASRRVDVVLRR